VSLIFAKAFLIRLPMIVIFLLGLAVLIGLFILAARKKK
jgi:LPXTG-motif cell wall-anchored protein